MAKSAAEDVSIRTSCVHDVGANRRAEEWAALLQSGKPVNRAQIGVAPVLGSLRTTGGEFGGVATTSQRHSISPEAE